MPIFAWPVVHIRQISHGQDVGLFHNEAIGSMFPHDHDRWIIPQFTCSRKLPSAKSIKGGAAIYTACPKYLHFPECSDNL